MKPIAEQSFYEILEIPRDAPAEEVEKAYLRAKALYGPGSLATYSLVAPEEMALLNRRIEEAHQVLLDAGTRAGYDLELLRAVCAAVEVPVIASGGVGTLEHLAEGLLVADAALAASIFHDGQHTVQEAKAFCRARGLEVRP